MPRQGESRYPFHSDEWCKDQPFNSSPTEGAASENIDNLSLKHSVEKGLHDAKGKSVSPDATSDAARPLSRHTVGGPEAFVPRAHEAGHQREYDGGTVGKQKPTSKASKRVSEDGELVDK
jgi:hypothetical protein